MGVSFEVLKKQYLKLSIEVDKEILLELSSRFTGPEQKWRTSTGLSIELNEIDIIIENLQNIKKAMHGSWVCQLPRP